MGIGIARLGFADRVQEARRSAGLTILQLSERSGIPKNTLLRRLVGDEGRFTLDELDRIATATDSAFEWILVGDAWYQRVEVAS